MTSFGTEVCWFTMVTLLRNGSGEKEEQSGPGAGIIRKLKNAGQRWKGDAFISFILKFSP